jgi:hypothetical protein
MPPGQGAAPHGPVPGAVWASAGRQKSDAISALPTIIRRVFMSFSLLVGVKQF